DWQQQVVDIPSGLQTLRWRYFKDPECCADGMDAGWLAQVSFVATEVNSAPVLPVQTNRTIAELTTLVVTNTASDGDLPANVLSYRLQAGPTNAVIDVNGVIVWTPDEGQGPGTNTFRTAVTDDGLPALSVTSSIDVIVTDA